MFSGVSEISMMSAGGMQAAETRLQQIEQMLQSVQTQRVS